MALEISESSKPARACPLDPREVESASMSLPVPSLWKWIARRKRNAENQTRLCVSIVARTPVTARIARAPAPGEVQPTGRRPPFREIRQPPERFFLRGAVWRTTTVEGPAGPMLGREPVLGRRWRLVGIAAPGCVRDFAEAAEQLA